jgi:hypothetical protein
MSKRRKGQKGGCFDQLDRLRRDVRCGSHFGDLEKKEVAESG